MVTVKIRIPHPKSECRPDYHLCLTIKWNQFQRVGVDKNLGSWPSSVLSTVCVPCSLSVEHRSSEPSQLAALGWHRGALLGRLNLSYVMWRTRNRVVWKKSLPLPWGDKVSNMFTGPALGIIWASAHEGPFHTLSFSPLWHLVGTNLKVEWMS